MNAGKKTLAPSSVWRLLQFYGVNRLDGLIVAQISEPRLMGVWKLLLGIFIPGIWCCAGPVGRIRPWDKKLTSLWGKQVETWQEEFNDYPGTRRDGGDSASVAVQSGDQGQ